MKKSIIFRIRLIFITLLFTQGLLMAGEINAYHPKCIALTDTLELKREREKKTTLKNTTIDSLSIKKITTDKTILDILDNVDTLNRIVAWRLNPLYYSLEATEGVDTSLNFPHLIIPTQKRLETLTSLGNLGSPLQSDNFFNRNRAYDFLFSRFYIDYVDGTTEHKQYHVKKPLTLITYSMGGKTSESEQIMRVVHSQNVNKYLNFGLTYDRYGTKGMYKRQQTKDNFFSFFASYFKNNFSAQGTITYNRIRNQENGGVESDFYVQDTTLENTLIPVKLHGASSEIKQKSFSGIVGYDIVNRWVKEVDKKGNPILIKKPVVSIKAIFEASKNTRTYSDTTTSFYKNYYINKGNTHDSAMLVTYESTVLGEINQLAKFPGLPGLRFWISNTQGKYYYFRPTDFIFKRSDDKIEANHVGVGVYSYSPYLSYSGSLRMYINGYRSADKELFGQMVISPWKSVEYPYVKAKIEITDKEPDLFIKNYFSNHFKWNNSFEKEKYFLLSGSIGADKWKIEAGYNVVRINNYIYFDTTGVPAQASGLTITSAYIKKDLKLGGFHFVNKFLWQAYDNKDVISLPTFSVFSSLFFDFSLVKNVLFARLGANIFIRSKFYADAYSPATGQFYNQREKQIGYPVVDVFADLKWKRAVIFFKADHINQGVPNSEYYSALHYPLNRFIFKIGVSWIFYD